LDYEKEIELAVMKRKWNPTQRKPKLVVSFSFSFQIWSQQYFTNLHLTIYKFLDGNILMDFFDFVRDF